MVTMSVVALGAEKANACAEEVSILKRGIESDKNQSTTKW